MDDEVQQTSQEIFDHIILGLAGIGLAGAIIAWAVAGFASPWFLRLITLGIIVLVAFILRRVGQFVIAAYVLVLELLGLVAGMFFEVDPLTGFAPYLFIPIIIIASLILTPNVVITITIFAIVLTLIIFLVIGQFTLANLLALLPPFGLLVLTTFLTTLGGSYLLKLDRRLAESSKLLRERTLELLKFMEKVKELQGNIAKLEQQVAQTQTEMGQVRRTAAQKDQRLCGLIQDMLQELKSSVGKLEQVVETIAEIPQLETQPNLLNEAWQKLDHLTRLVISIADLIQLENDELQLEVQTVDVAQLLRELVEVMRGLAREKNLELRSSISPDLPPLEVDPIRLRQALLHVLGNAVKYTNQGVIEVQTELTEHELLIFVSDTGVGMPAETVKTLFQDSGGKNGRPDHTRRGPGLGLTITKRLIELHGGRIEATSVPGVGSTFSIALPLPSTRIDLIATILSAKPLPTTVAAQNSTPTLVATSKLTSEPPKPAVEETRLSATPVRTILPTSSGDAQASSPDSGRRGQQNGGSFPPPAPRLTTQTPAYQTTLPPVARFSPTYINRFGLTLLGMLLAIIAIVAALAWMNGPIQRKATPTRLAQVIGSPAATNTPPLKEKIKPEPTGAPAAILSPTQTPRPTPTVSPTSPPELSATLTPIGAKPLPEQITPVPPTPLTDQPVRATATTLATPRSEPQDEVQTPTPTVTSTPTPPPTSTPEPTPVVVTPPPVVSPVVKFSPPDLSVITKSEIAPAITLLNFEPGSGVGLAAITEETAHSGLSWRQGQALFSGEVNGAYDIYLVQPGKSSPVDIAPAPGDDLQPAWSPDGRKIAFSSGRNGNLDIYVVNSDCVLQPGGCAAGPVQLTTSRGFDEWPAWSPDGRRLAFVSDRDGNVEVYVMNSDGSQQQRLTNHPADDWPAAWSPDGRRLVFASNRDGQWNLYVMGAGGGEPTRLTNDPGDEREPAWSPDGRAIAFAYRSSDNWDIYTLPAPTASISELPRSAWTQVALTAADEHYPTWLK